MVAAFRVEGERVLLTLRLTPKGGRDCVEGVKHLADDRAVLIARVRAVPEDGAANAALLKLLAKELAVPASSLGLVSGATSRIKTVQMPCSAEILVRLEALCQPQD
jgi:uncharacterized protein